MKYELYEGDCLEKMKDIPDGSVDMILCDLPYGVSQCPWDKPLPLDELWQEYKRVTKVNGTVLLFATQPFLADVVNSNRPEFSCVWIWVKNTKTGHLNAKRQPLKRTEEIAVFTVNKQKKKGKNIKSPTYNPQGLIKLDKPFKTHRREIPKIYGQNSKSITYKNYTNYPDQLLYFDAPMVNRVHPTQKPVDLLAYLIKTYSNEGETVLDCCMGSGSTGVACIQTGRNFIGIELDEKYFHTAYDRMREAEREIDYADFAYIEFAANMKEGEE